jgi:hypothetical protein
MTTENYGRRLAAAGAIGIGVLITGCNGNAVSSSSAAGAAVTAAPGTLATSQQTAEFLDRIVAPPGWKISLWAVGGGKKSNPDAIEIDGANIWVGYQNASVKDGSNNALTSTIVEYTLDGKVVNTWTVPGHTDGLRVDPSTHKAWVTSNEDALPVLEIIDPSNPTPQAITLAATAHGGGYDDLAFVGGITYIACSNPTLDASGNNVFPAIDKVTVSGSTATLTPVLMGNAKATDAVAKAPTTLNLTDPDSLTTDTHGNLVLVSQADSAIITIANPGAASQTVTKTPIGNQEDDTVWATANSGRLFIADGTKNAIYTVNWSGPKGTVFTEAPNDSGVVGFVGTIDMTTGFITPIITGMGKPTGLIFVPGG